MKDKDNVRKLIAPDIYNYIENDILPKYDAYDEAHSQRHIRTVIKQSFEICHSQHFFDQGAGSLNPNMVYVVAAYHDLGICEGRTMHHIASGRMLVKDRRLRQWFTGLEIATMKEAVEDHRASTGTVPRSLYGRVVSEADKTIDPDLIIARTILYGLEHFPELGHEGLYKRNIAHLREKYGDGGYLKLQFEGTPNARRLEELRQIIRDPKRLAAEYAKFEVHPLQPFIPEKAQTLFLGSFPPPAARWCMNFYYPNFQNDMWRILGIVFYNDKNHFIVEGQQRFNYDKVVAFCNEISLAIYDAAYMVKREKGNASDQFLKIMMPTDLKALLAKMPDCNAVVSTGGKSAEMTAELLGCDMPKVGGYLEVEWTGRTPGCGTATAARAGNEAAGQSGQDRQAPQQQDAAPPPARIIRFYRMPSSSRAFPMRLEDKVAMYRKVFGN